ncbi:hypothetical protein [Brevibacillus sp. H7]|jgi:hypothetical protein|uniref:hypothetical protein n=1 Tax=Brevibacillus sp. H7 TaxID=3349138 RepID=UPI0038069566
MERLNQLSEAHNSSNEQIMREMGSVRQELHEMKEVLHLLRVKPKREGRSGGLLFGRRRTIPVQMEPEKPKLTLPLDQLLPLLPQLGGVIPQLKNPKVVESIKVLANPAVIAIIQQFLANGGLSGKLTQVSGGGRRGIH